MRELAARYATWPFANSPYSATAAQRALLLATTQQRGITRRYTMDELEAISNGAK